MARSPIKGGDDLARPHSPGGTVRRDTGRRSSDRRRAAWLTVAAAASFALALLHVGMVFVGVTAYEYFTAPRRMIDLAYQGSVQPPLITLLVALVFAVFGAYALAGAGRAPALPTLPVLRLALIGISGIFLLRGVLIVPQWLLYLHTSDVPPRALAFSAVALAIGICYTVGTARRWRWLPISTFERSAV